MFYLKYRPKDFSQLFGLEDVVRSLKNALQKGQLAHAYIFTGPKGSGKTTTARILAKALNCERGGAGPCNECPTCAAINEGRFLDLIEIDAASNRGIDDIRDLREKIKLAPSSGKYKVYIIDEAHMLTPEAFNALLKTLEEPPAHAYFILATTELNKIPETIKSRCLVVHFRRARKEDLVRKLEFICREEGANLSPERIQKIVALSEGGFRNAETLLEQAVVGESDLTQTDFSAADFVEHLIDGNQRAALEYLNHLYESGENLAVFSQRLVFYLRGLLLLLGGVGADVLEVDEESFAKMESQAKGFGRERLIFALNKFLAAADLGRFAPVPSLPLELAVFDICREQESGAETPEDGPVKDDVRQENPAPPGKEARTLDEVKEAWETVLKEVRPFNHSLEALLRSARPKEVRGEKDLVVEVFYKFHKDRLAEPRNREILDKVFGRVFGPQKEVVFVLGERRAPPKTPAPAGDEDIVSAALKAFGA